MPLQDSQFNATTMETGLIPMSQVIRRLVENPNSFPVREHRFSDRRFPGSGPIVKKFPKSKIMDGKKPARKGKKG